MAQGQQLDTSGGKVLGHPGVAQSGRGAVARATSLFFGEIPTLIADSISKRPGEWVGSVHRASRTGPPYELYHISGAKVWLGNGSYGIDVSGPGLPTWGGVTFLSSFGLSPGHWLIWLAARRWLRAYEPSAVIGAADRLRALLSGAKQ